MKHTLVRNPTCPTCVLSFPSSLPSSPLVSPGPSSQARSPLVPRRLSRLHGHRSQCEVLRHDIRSHYSRRLVTLFSTKPTTCPGSGHPDLNSYTILVWRTRLIRTPFAALATGFPDRDAIANRSARLSTNRSYSRAFTPGTRHQRLLAQHARRSHSCC
jgi:hypothetical protein